MGINTRPVLDPRWAFHHRGVSTSFQICDVNIYNEQLSSRVYNPTTNAWDSTETSIWAGKARIQPLATAADRNMTGNNTEVQRVEMQIDFAGSSIADIRPGSYVIVSNSPLDANLTKFIYIVKSVMNSSNPWQRTLMCEVDMEADPSA
jgi:hypothetical protein